MIYLSSFKFSSVKVKSPHAYPYNVFAKKTEDVLVFRPITILYGNNASGKSTMLNIIANTLGLAGCEYAACNRMGMTPYFMNFINECKFSFGETEDGKTLRKFPADSKYIKSEDIL